MSHVAIIGAGAWGTALAGVCARAGQAVRLWAREPEVVESINRRHENALFLAGVALDRGIEATGDLETAVGGSCAVLLVTPAQHLREVAGNLAPYLPEGAPVALCAKGIERDGGALMSEAAAEAIPRSSLAVLSGPTFAREVANGLPTAVTLAVADSSAGERLVDAIGNPSFRPYLSDDLIGAQIGGAVKNVLAIACGIVHGRGLGENARAALITRGLAEIVRLGIARGARPETLMGLSGLGDLTLTCNSLQSRNMSLGSALGEGRRLDDILGERRSVAEGVWSAGAVRLLADRAGVDMPIATAVDEILHHGATVDDMIADLLSRPFRSEREAD